MQVSVQQAARWRRNAPGECRDAHLGRGSSSGQPTTPPTFDRVASGDKGGRSTHGQHGRHNAKEEIVIQLASTVKCMGMGVILPPRTRLKRWLRLPTKEVPEVQIKTYQKQKCHKVVKRMGALGSRRRMVLARASPRSYGCSWACVFVSCHHSEELWLAPDIHLLVIFCSTASSVHVQTRSRRMVPARFQGMARPTKFATRADGKKVAQGTARSPSLETCIKKGNPTYGGKEISKSQK